jgi:hypothetical protein
MHATFLRNMLKIQNMEDVQIDEGQSRKVKVDANCKIRN